MDPRVLKATSVKAEDPAAQRPEPQALKITAASSNPKMFTLPWEKPLATWPEDLLVNLPRGISRHVVRFVHVGDEVYAMKEITRNVAEREYELLRRLQKLELPTVQPIAVVTGRHNAQGEPLEAILGMYQAILPSANSLIKCLVIFNMPFTLVKGLLDALICMLIYKPLSPILHGRK